MSTFDYHTGFPLLHKETLLPDERRILKAALDATDPQIFVLPYGQDNGNWTLDRGYDEYEDWTTAYGTFRTREQTRWFVVLLRPFGDGNYRVAGRLIFEDGGIPACGNEIRQMLSISILHGGHAIEVRKSLSSVPRADYAWF